MLLLGIRKPSLASKHVIIIATLYFGYQLFPPPKFISIFMSLDDHKSFFFLKLVKTNYNTINIQLQRTVTFIQLPICQNSIFKSMAYVIFL